MAILALASESGAAPRDNAALRHDREAMDSDYLANNWSGAETKLRRALRDCGARSCSTKVRAQVQLHLGIILVNAGKVPEAGAAFTEALRLNPSATPEPDFANPDVVKTFDEIKRKLSGASATPPPPAPPPPPAETEPAPPSDLVHTAVTEQALSTPVPIYAEGEAARMVLYYRGATGGDFTKLEMRRAGKGFRAVVPCRETAAAGSVSYYIIALDAKGEPVGGAGTRRVPYQVAIKARVEGEPPHFPGEGPLAACPSGAVCPPGVDEAGCEKASKGQAGASCSDASPCGEGLACDEGVCRAGKAAGVESKKNWLSLSASIDIAVVAGNDDVCSLASQKDRGSYACFRDGDDPYRGQPQPGEGGTLSGYVRPGTLRFLVGYDRMLSPNVALGGRAGYAIRGWPKAFYGETFLPAHAELRGTYIFGDQPLARRGIHPYGYVAGGLGPAGAEVPNVQVEDDCGYGGRPACPEGQQRAIITVSAHRRLGRFFGGAGFGALWLFAPSTGVYADVKVSAFFPTVGFAVAPSLGVTQGF
ncbi:MAG TPA: hypothetical protein VFS43_35960 [Polyangiaceae bacterium]|nr:hypothetical protein [Polyangiaceae bacterium]